MLAYRIDIVADDESGFLVTSPDFPELVSFGDTEREAASHGMRAVEEAIAARIDDRRELPPPIDEAVGRSSRQQLVQLSTTVALKVCLYRLIGQNAMSVAQLAQALAWSPPRVDRLIRLDEPAPLDDLESAFEALGSRIDFRVRPAAAA